MAEAQGQAAEQPAGPLNPFEAQALIASQIEAAEKQAATPRDETGKFAPKTPPAEPQAEPEQPAEAPAEAKAEAPEAPVEEEPAQPSWKLKLQYKGEEKEVDEAEARELAQKGYDYTQKTQALAKEKEELAAKVKAAEEQARQQYEQKLEIQKQTVLKLADQEALNADLNKLALEDPAKAQQLFFKRIQIQQALQGIEAEQSRLVQQRQAEAQETMRKQAAEAVEKLQQRIPQWNNDLYGKILKGAVDSYGFQSSEVNAITDHRAIEVLHDALKYRELQAAKPKTVEKRVAAVPKVQKPGTVSEKADPNAKAVQDSMAALSKTGSRDAAHAYALALINAGRI